ncbi:hypothetical protein [Ferrovibrio sp.]|uniref:hypothetical protein n=1 Tax=Ferrovibrio sp. TaxID=1917215 RepID=UPI0035B0506F
MTTIEDQIMAKLNIAKLSLPLLRLWHAVLAGGFLVAYLTADEDTYAMHLFAGYIVLAAIAIRLLAGIFAPQGNLWRLPRPSIGGTLAWFGRRRGRNPFFAWFAVALLGFVGLAAATGAIADFVTWMEDLHEGVAETALWVIFGHIAFVIVIYNGRRIAAWISQRLSGGGLSRNGREVVR